MSTRPESAFGAGRAEEDRHSSIIATASSLLVSRLSATGLGALAWLVATRLFPVDEIGHAAAIIGVCTFVGNASLVGLDQTIIRFARQSQGHSQSDLIQGAMALAPVLALAGAFLAIPFALTPGSRGAVGGELAILVLPVGAAFCAATLMGESALLALGLARAVLISNLSIAMTRLGAVFGLVLVRGPLSAAYLLSWGFGTALIVIYLSTRLKFSTKAVRQGIRGIRVLAAYSTTSYVATMLDVAALSLLPLLILNLTDAGTAGVFQVVWLISSFLFMVPVTVARSVFVHQSSGALAPSLSRRAAWSSIAFGLVLSAGAILAAPSVMGLLGPSYQAGSSALAWIGASTAIVAYSSMRVSFIRVSGDMRRLAAASLIHLVVLIIGVVVLLPSSGLTAVGVAWFAAQVTFAIAVTSRGTPRSAG